MKKLMLLIFLVYSALFSIAQDKYVIAGNTLLPAGWEKISGDQANLHVIQRFHTDSVYGNNGVLRYDNPNFFYCIGNVLILLNLSTMHEDTDSLRHLKWQTDGIIASNPHATNYRSLLSTINGHLVLTYYLLMDGVGWCRIFTEDPVTHRGRFKAQLYYAPTDLSKAENIANYITDRLQP